MLLVVFLTSFPLSITRATVNEVSHEATQNFQNLFDFVTVDPSSGDHDFAVSKSMVTWGDLVEFLNETQQGELYTPEMNSFITRSPAGTSSSQVSYAINADHPEYESEPAICSLDTAKRYCNYKEVSFERQLNQHDGEQDHVGQATSQAYFHLLSTTQYQQWKAASSQSFDALKSDDRCEWIENNAVDAEPVPQLLQHGSEPQLFPSQGDHVGGFRLVVDKGLMVESSERTTHTEPLLLSTSTSINEEGSVKQINYLGLCADAALAMWDINSIFVGSIAPPLGIGFLIIDMLFVMSDLRYFG
ncbi:MAG: hypothetical protein K9M81_02745 [Chthoniobacterales bacterium]|nr:hypothetical protein [Chthoniobacterales bacterium]